MTDWLLQTFSTSALTVLILSVLLILAVGGCIAFRRWAPDFRDAIDDNVAGVIVSILAGIYGIVLAFVIVVLWEDLQSAQQVVSTEANALSQIVEDGRAFPPATRGALDGAVRTYVHAVVDEEWDRMRTGRESARAAAGIDGLFRVMRDYEPGSPKEEAFYSEASTNLDQLQGDRRERLRLSQRGLPGIIEALIVGGALLIIGFTYFFSVESLRIHVLMCAGVALLLGFSVLLSLLLQHPFAGDISVKSTPFRQGVLAQFWP